MTVILILLTCGRLYNQKPENLQNYLRYIDYNEKNFNEAKYSFDDNFLLNTENNFDRAVNYIIRNRFSRGGMGEDFAQSSRLRGGQNEQINSWKTIIESIPFISLRIRNVKFYRQYAQVIIQHFDSPDTLIYCDPPYVPHTRTSPKVYDYEMGEQAHKSLIDILKNCKSKIFLSGYGNSIYNNLNWHRHEFHVVNHSSQSKIKNKRIETLWEN